MYNINNVTLEERNCIQSQSYFKTFKIQTIWNTEQENKGKFKNNEWKEKKIEIISHDQKNLKTNITHFLVGSWTSSGISRLITTWVVPEHKANLSSAS